MFTGIVEEVGTIEAIERGAQSARFTVRARRVTEDVKLGDSITVNGACLTVVAHTPDTLAFDAVYETLQKTALGALAISDEVNLERSMPAQGRFGGHVVQGHVDGVGTIASIREVDNAYTVYVNAPAQLMRYIVRKGSIAMNGISLTVVDADDRTFSVAIIPHTWEHTNLRHHIAGDQINLETDIIGKYVEKMMGDRAAGGDFARPASLSERPAPIANLAREEAYILDAAPSYWE